MTNRKILYGYQIRHGELAIVPQEAEVVQRVTALYLDGLSYQRISDILNSDGFPFSVETPLWNKHKVKRLLENPRYTGEDGYPPMVERRAFNTVQSMIREKTSHYAKTEKRPALRLKAYLRCGSCHGRLLGMGGKGQRRGTLYLRCEGCGMMVTLPDSALLSEVNRQMTEHDAPTEESYIPSGEVIRLTNAVNRGLEHPDKPEDVVSLILRGASARYDCCPTLIESEPFNRPAEVDIKRFGQATRAGLAVSHIAITGNQDITVHFK